ncbi:MAG: 50S ribosomal protein L29 [Bacteroidota bacterium]
MKYQDISKLAPKELKEKLTNEREELKKLKLAHKINSIENPMQIRHRRKLVAQIKTALNNSKS